MVKINGCKNKKNKKNKKSQYNIQTESERRLITNQYANMMMSFLLDFRMLNFLKKNNKEKDQWEIFKFSKFMTK